MQMAAANVPSAVLSTMEGPYGARVPNAGSPHGKAAAFRRRCLSSLTWGHDGPTCVHGLAWVSIYVCVCVCFCLWQHIAWFLGTARCPHGARRSMNGSCVCHDEADRTRLRVLESRRRIGWVCDRKRGREGGREGGDRDKEGVMIYREVTFCLVSDAVGIQVVHLKCLHGWLIKSEKLLLLINWQARTHMSGYSQPCMNRLHNEPNSYLFKLYWHQWDFKDSIVSLFETFSH